ncbi:MAG TPA: TPM domain-containing protein, partial [Sediminispirochaeta sp.]|nr:TPM domain-containing protein [Sediminispirochaeta sp.]
MLFLRKKTGQRSEALLIVLLAALTLPQALTAQELPEARGFVNDFAEVIDGETEAKIQAIAERVREKTGAEIAVITVQSLEPYGSIEEYS